MYGIPLPAPVHHFRCAVCNKSEVYFNRHRLGSGRRRRYCSKACADIAVKRMRDALAILYSAPCSECGESFYYRARRGKPPRYCSVKCKARRAKGSDAYKQALKRWQASNPGKVAAYRSKNRHTRRGAMAATAETFDPAEIHARDKWRCLLCGCRVKKKSDGYDPQLATLDHIVPLSRGGSHTMANCQTACHMCNSKKNAKTIGQLRFC